MVDDVFAEDPVDDWLTLVGVYCLRTLEPFRDDPRCGTGSTRGWRRSLEWTPRSGSRPSRSCAPSTPATG